MAVSMKDVDPAFQQGIGHKAGLEIWQIENSRPSAIPRPQHGRFCTGRSYIILQTCALKSGVFHHDIHYWLGSCTSQDEAATAAVKAVELNASLGGRAVQTREVEGYESEKFLSYFKPCFIPIGQGGTFSAAIEGMHHQQRMFICKGRHVVRVKEVPFTRSSLSHDDVFVLDTKSKIFQFNGANTDIYQRAKALDVVQYLKENSHKEKCHVAIIEGGKFVADADSGEFWGLFGGFAPLMRKMDDEDYEIKVTAGTLFTILEGHTDKPQASPLKREMLSANKSYILDCGKELFAWVGHDTSLKDKKASILVAEEMSVKCESPLGIKLVCATEGFEPIEFRSKFDSWPTRTTLPISEGGRGKVAVLLKQKGFNVKGLLKTAPAQEMPQLFSSLGKLQVWCVNGNSKECLPSGEYGKFYNNNCYVVLHTCLVDQNEEHLVCSWLGHQSTKETKATAAYHANDIASSLQGNTVEVWIFEGKEPTQFLSLFDRLFLMKDNEKKDEVSLFQVHQSDPRRWHAVQVSAVAASLNSSSCYFLQARDSFFTWYGKFSTLEEQEATKNMVYHLEPDATLATLKEGSETQFFWDTLGGRQIYPSHQEPKDSAKDPRLFSCTLVKDQVKVTEVFNFTQEDLLSDEVTILDCYTSIFVWVGQATSSQHKLKAFEFGQKYLEQVAKYEGISLEIPIYKIIEGCEPLLFTSLFCWDSTKVKHHLNPFERKVLALKGESIKATEVIRSRKRSPIPDGKGFQLTADKAKLGRNLTFKPEHSMTADKAKLGRNLTFKPEHSMDRNRQPKTKTGYGHSPGKSAAVSALSTMFEFQSGREAPPNTPIVKLSTLSLKTKEPIKESPPATPSSSRTPRSCLSPAIATLTSVYESYHDRFAFAWPGMKSRHEEKGNREFEPCSYGTENRIIEDEQEMPTSITQALVVDMENGEVDQTYPYERLKVSSANPVLEIDSSKRESYLSSEEFQETFHMDKDTFYKLPRWKQDKYKVLFDLF